jgi:type I restriction enzyme, S subunit
LRKHETKPGDVLIGTLGDPNLRACIQPASLPVALNKADCVQMRPDSRRATSEFVCALLNHPSTAKMAERLTLGQTRLRISMGRLRGLEVPVPPLATQIEFGRRVRAVQASKSRQEHFNAVAERLFASLQHRAFTGAL